MTSHARRPGAGPRQAERIYTAALRLLRERGFDAVAIETVAADSGVNKTTIYRWWHSKEALIADALTGSPLFALDTSDTGSLRGDLRALVARVRELLTDPDTAPIAIAVFSAAASRPELAELVREFFADRLRREQSLFDRAIDRGEVSEDVDVTLTVDMALGTVWARVILRQATPGAGFDTEVADLLMDGLTSH